MILEIATFEIVPGQEAAFEAGVGQAQELFARAKGCLGMSLRKVIERPSTYQLMVEWETLEDHTIGFRTSADFGKWRELVGGYFASTPVVEHSQPVTLRGAS